MNKWKNKNNKNAKVIATGKVSIHASAIFFSVPLFKLPLPPDAIIDPAIPLDKTCVVLTGKPNQVLNPIVEAAIISEVAPCA